MHFTLTHHDAAITLAPREQGKSPVSVARPTLGLTLPVSNSQVDAGPDFGTLSHHHGRVIRPLVEPHLS
jgi:hypothetical protein